MASRRNHVTKDPARGLDYSWASHTIRQAGPAVADCVRFEVEGAGATGVVALAGWYNAASGRAGPAGEVEVPHAIGPLRVHE